jgi:hypothetical protein
MKYTLPIDYTQLKPYERKQVREQYILEQNGNCYYCGESLDKEPPTRITDKPIKWNYFPEGFLNAPIHLQHNHDTGMTEGAVHNYCNAVLWQYEGR